MAKIKLTKNELKRQKDALKRFIRYLPTLQLKKQQIQMELMKLTQAIQKLKDEEKVILNGLNSWIQVLGENLNIKDLIQIEKIEKDTGNIAGVDIPIFKNVIFKEIEYNLYSTPLWFDKAIKIVKEVMAIQIQITILEEQISLLREELRITTQRVNLFEKVKIPESKDNIRIIQIYLGDQQTAAVVRGKISKNKIIRLEESKAKL